MLKGFFATQGYFLRPTVAAGLDDNTRCMQEEVFGGSDF